MKKSKFTEAQIIFLLNQSESGVWVVEICPKMDVSDPTFYNRKKRYGDMGRRDAGAEVTERVEFQFEADGG